MKSSKRVLFVCATGIATSTVVEEKVIEYCRDHGVEFDFDQRNVASVPQIQDDFDVIIATTQVPYEMDKPIINALPVLTGFGAESVFETILETLKG